MIILIPAYEPDGQLLRLIGSVAAADPRLTIVVVDDGKIVEEGSHKDLLYKKGVYANLWNRQSGGFLES